MNLTCEASEVYKRLDGGKFGCASCKEVRDTKPAIVIHAATTHGIRPAKNLIDGGKP
jgi:hypothetical protein